MQHDVAAASNEDLWQLDSLEGRGNGKLDVDSSDDESAAPLWREA